jgi:hypothetical protein
MRPSIMIASIFVSPIMNSLQRVGFALRCRARIEEVEPKFPFGSEEQKSSFEVTAVEREL